MNNFFLILIALLGFSASKDRLQKPERCEFRFENASPEHISGQNASGLIELDTQITSRTKVLAEAVIRFETGEVLRFRQDEQKWKSIQLEYKGKIVAIPAATVKKIGVVHFSKIEYVWQNESENPFQAGYSAIRFPVGTTKVFGKLPEVNLCFSHGKFEKANVKKYVESNAYQYFALD